MGANFWRSQTFHQTHEELWGLNGIQSLMDFRDVSLAAKIGLSVSFGGLLLAADYTILVLSRAERKPLGSLIWILPSIAYFASLAIAAITWICNEQTGRSWRQNTRCMSILRRNSWSADIWDLPGLGYRHIPPWPYELQH